MRMTILTTIKLCTKEDSPTTLVSPSTNKVEGTPDPIATTTTTVAGVPVCDRVVPASGTDYPTVKMNKRTL
jgi:hypothetical protein